MTWILVLIVVLNTEIEAQKINHYSTMSDCFSAREQVVEDIGRPIIDYQVICVPENTDREINI